MKISIIITLLYCCLLLQADGQTTARYKISINEKWEFHKGDLDNDIDTVWQKVNVPHSWNTVDAFDEEPGYYRGICWYRKSLNMDRFPKKEKAFLHFEATNQTAELFVNGQPAGKHAGGYTAFTFEITRFLKSGDNQLLLKVDNSHNPSIVPLKGDFTFYGGVYRDVWLVLTGNTHFDMMNLGSTGVFISTPKAREQSAEISVCGTAIIGKNHGNSFIHAILYDAEGNTVQEIDGPKSGDEQQQEFQFSMELKTPRLWSPDDPYLYQLLISIQNDTGKLDEISIPVGIRWFFFDADKGFFLNGKSLSLRGANRHQDYPGKANALSNAEHLRDMQLIKSMGANFYRPAHYPQDPAVLEACDRLGLLVTMEIPLDHEQTNDTAFYELSKTMMQEMIRQYYNHPSIIIWAYMNEMFLGRKLARDREAIDLIVAFAKELETLTREEDPTRYTMIPNHGDFDVYHESGLTRIPMIVGWNLYYGWYEPDNDGFGKFADHAHRMLPDKPLIITEYGAGADPRLRSLKPLRFDFSVEWETAFHLNHLRQMAARPFIAGAAVWNMFDFGSEDRIDAVPNINNKGLAGYDRTPKDAFYLYKAWLTKEPFIHIATTGWQNRIAVAAADEDFAEQEVWAFGNVAKAELLHNGRSLGIREFEDKTAVWKVPFASGENILELKADANGSPLIVRENVHMQLLPDKGVVPVDLLSMNFGADFHFIETESNVMWLPEQEKSGEGWGYAGGTQYKPRSNGIGTNRDIMGTSDDPLFQTQRQDIRQLAFNLPPGAYRLTFLFAELEKKSAGERQFAVSANGTVLLPRVDISADFGMLQAVSQSIELYLDKPELIIEFIPIKGSTILNGIQIQRK